MTLMLGFKVMRLEVFRLEIDDLITMKEALVIGVGNFIKMLKLSTLKVFFEKLYILID
jgi:hypothetical protein